jgi:hypothetical protein
MLRQLALQALVLQMSVVRCSALRSLRVEVAACRTQIRSLHVQVHHVRLFLSICALSGSKKHFAVMLAGCDRALLYLCCASLPVGFSKDANDLPHARFSAPCLCSVPAVPLCRSGCLTTTAVLLELVYFNTLRLFRLSETNALKSNSTKF